MSAHVILDRSDGSECYRAWPWQKITFIDGSIARGPIAFRWRGHDGEWKYRQMTSQEQKDWNRSVCGHWYRKRIP